MADNLTLNAGSGGATLKTDDDGTAHWQEVKIAFGADNTQTRVTSSVGLPIADAGGSITVDAAELTTLAGAVTGSEMQVDIVSGDVTNAGTFAVQVDGDALTALQLIDNIVQVEDAVHGTGDSGVMSLAVRNDTLAALAGTDGDYAPLQVNASGALFTAVDGTVTVDGSGVTQPVSGTVAVTNAGTFATQVDGDALTALQLIDDVVHVDDTATHATGTSKGVLLMAAATPTDGSVSANDIGALAMSTDRRLLADVQIAGQDADVTIADGGNSITIDGTVTADLGLTDTVALDTCKDHLNVIQGAVAAGQMQVDIVTGTVTANLSATDNNVLDDIAAKLAPATSGGISTVFRDEDIDEAAVACKAGAGQVYWIHCINLDATPVYLHFYDVAQGSVTVGTTGELCSFAVPSQGDANGAGFTMHFNHGIQFSTAITVACTTTIGGTAGPGTNEVILNVGYA